MSTCDCGANVEAERLPPGWKRHKARVWCRDCWRAAYRLRAVTLPVAGADGRTWPELNAALSICWELTTTLANFEVQELAKNDLIRLPDDEKLGRMPARPTKGPRAPYQRAREIVPDLDTRSVTSVLRAVQNRYVKRRYEVVWRRAAALPTYRYPMPYPVHNQAWRVRLQDRRVLVDVPLVGGERWTLRLKTGSEFRRQLAAIRLLVEGEALQGELAIYRTRSDRASMCKMVMWLPRQERGELSGALHVRTTKDAMLVYHADGDEKPQYLYRDDLRRLVSAHARRLDHREHDRKLPRRLKGEEPAWLSKHRRRMDSIVHEISAQVAGYAMRRKVERVVLDMSERGYFPARAQDGNIESFPWSIFETRLAYKLDDAGIEMLSSGDMVREQAAPLDAE